MKAVVVDGIMVSEGSDLSNYYLTYVRPVWSGRLSLSIIVAMASLFWVIK